MSYLTLRKEILDALYPHCSNLSRPTKRRLLRERNIALGINPYIVFTSANVRGLISGAKQLASDSVRRRGDVL